MAHKIKPKPKTIIYNPTSDPKRMHGYDHVRWVENASLGLRLVGFADEITTHLRHTGWWTDEDRGSKYRGIVYQLPAGRGYVYGYADPDNDDCAIISFNPVQDKCEAARYADRFARLFADDEREYREAWSAGRRAEELADEAKAMRKQALAIADEMRVAKAANVNAPTICATMRAQIKSLYHDIQHARKERAELIENFGHRPGFVE